MEIRNHTGVSKSLHSFKCTGGTVISAARAQVKAGDCKALKFAFIYIAFHSACSRLHFPICNFKVGTFKMQKRTGVELEVLYSR